MKVLLYPAIESERLEAFRAAAPSLLIANAADHSSALLEIADADGFVGKIDRELLAAASKLRWVQAPTSSLGLYMFPELVDHACIMTSARGLFSDIIAGQVFAYILCFARNFHHYIRNQQARRWHPIGSEGPQTNLVDGMFAVTEWDRAHRQLADATLGIVGLGNIGSEIARLGLAFGMRVVAVDPVQTQAPEGVEHLWRPDHLDELLATSDFVVIAVPQAPGTEKMFRREQFRSMKPTAYLINIARGVVVDLADLTAALQAGELGGAGLDVFETEPLPADHPLWGMENVIITPHVAAYSARLPDRFWGLMQDNVQRFAEGRPLRNVVNKALGF